MDTITFHKAEIASNVVGVFYSGGLERSVIAIINGKLEVMLALGQIPKTGTVVEVIHTENYYPETHRNDPIPRFAFVDDKDLQRMKNEAVGK